MHCTKHPWLDDGGSDIESSRFSPKEGVQCQTQCWRDTEKTKNVELFGLRELMAPDNRWNFTATQFIEESWLNYEATRLSPRYTLPSMEDLGKAQPAMTRTGSALPVCFSDMIPRNFNHKRNKDKALACICGDSYGNETMAFFAETHMSKWQYYRGGTGLAEACQTSFEIHESDPVAVFLTFCQMDKHFPYHINNWHDEGIGFGSPADDCCMEFEHECNDLIEEKGMGSVEVNCRMCLESQVGQQVMRHQTDWYKQGELDYPVNHYNFKKACELYAKKHCQ